MNVTTSPPHQMVCGGSFLVRRSARTTYSLAQLWSCLLLHRCCRKNLARHNSSPIQFVVSMVLVMLRLFVFGVAVPFSVCCFVLCFFVLPRTAHQ